MPQQASLLAMFSCSPVCCAASRLISSRFRRSLPWILDSYTPQSQGVSSWFLSVRLPHSAVLSNIAQEDISWHLHITWLSLTLPLHMHLIWFSIFLQNSFLLLLKWNCSGTILFSFSLFGKIVGCAMLANAFFNIFILFKYPQYEDAQRNDAQSEIRDYLSSHPAFARQAVRGATDFVKSNPGELWHVWKILLSTHRHVHFSFCFYLYYLLLLFIFI